MDVERFLADSADRGTKNRARLTQMLSRLVQSELGETLDVGLSDLFAVLEATIHQVEFALRKELSTLLAGRDDCPPGLVRFLSNDEIDIALPVILRSKLLQETDLLEIAEHRTLEHRLALAQRAGLPHRVSEAIVGAEEEGPLLALLNNKDTKLRTHVMEYMIEQSRRYTSMQEPLLHRGELTRDLALKLAAHASAAIQAAIMSKFRIDKQAVEDAVRHAEATFNKSLGALMDEWGKADELVETLIRRQRLNVQSLPKLLHTGETALFISGFRHYTQLPKLLAHRILFEPGGEALAVVCKAIGLHRDGFVDLHRAVAPARLGDPATIAQEGALAAQAYERVPMDRAQQILEYWQNDKDFLTARRAVRQLMQSRNG